MSKFIENKEGFVSGHMWSLKVDNLLHRASGVEVVPSFSKIGAFFTVPSLPTDDPDKLTYYDTIPAAMQAVERAVEQRLGWWLDKED